jgi:anti-sigma factor RsiW
MKCDDCHAFIEEYVDGELQGHRADLIAEHLITCKRCATVAGALQREQEIYRSYQRAIEVTPDMWARVDARIKQDQLITRPGLLSELLGRLTAAVIAPRLSPALVALLIVLAIGAALLVETLVSSRSQVPQIAMDRGADEHKDRAPSPANVDVRVAGGTAASKQVEDDAAGQQQHAVHSAGNSGMRGSQKPNAFPRQASPQQLIREAEQKYLAAIAILSRDFNKRRTTMDPTVLARFDGVLQQIDFNILETRRAYRQNPQDPTALQYLLAAYSKKVEVLREVTLN